jgi:hypothetical protein
MIATGYEENSIDREKRDQLHQQWLEQQDTTGMDSLLQKLNCGSRLKESDDEEEDEESKETDNESDDEAEDFTAPSDAVKINLKKVKQMIPQMFTDKDEPYVSSDEETEERLAKQCLSLRVVSSHFLATIINKCITVTLILIEVYRISIFAYPK